MAHELEQPPVIDGDLSDPIWFQAQAVELTAQGYPDPGQPPSFATRVRLLYDRKALYLAFACEDPEPHKIVDRITTRDRLVESDWVRVEIDSQGDRRTGFYFLLNAAGVKVDGTLFGEREESADWDGVWEGRARVATQGQKGWTAELRTPLAQHRDLLPGEAAVLSRRHGHLSYPEPRRQPAGRAVLHPAYRPAPAPALGAGRRAARVTRGDSGHLRSGQGCSVVWGSASRITPGPVSGWRIVDRRLDDVIRVHAVLDGRRNLEHLRMERMLKSSATTKSKSQGYSGDSPSGRRQGWHVRRPLTN